MAAGDDTVFSASELNPGGAAGNANSAGAIPGQSLPRQAVYTPGLAATDFDAFLSQMRSTSPNINGGRYRVPLMGDVSYGSNLEEFGRYIKQEHEAGRFSYQFTNRYGSTQDVFSNRGTVNTDVRFEHPSMGQMTIPAGANIADFFSRPQQIQYQQRMAMAGMAAQGVQTLASPITNPSYTPGADIVGGLGGIATGAAGMGVMAGALTGPVGFGIALAGMGASVASGMYRSVVNPVGESMGTLTQLERPLERLANAGFGTAGVQGSIARDLKGYGSRFGYGTQEAAHVLAEFSGAAGFEFGSADMRKGGLGDLPFEADLQGISRATVGFYARGAQAGGAYTGGAGALNQAIRGDIDTARGMGLRGGGITEYLQRIAATVEGMGQRGLKIQEGSVGKLAATISASTLEAAGGAGHEQEAYGFGARSAELAGNLAQFTASASHMLDVPGTSSYGKGLLLSMATDRARAAGRGDHIGIQMEQEDLAKDPASLLKGMEQRGISKELMVQTLKTTGGFSTHEAVAYYEGAKKIRERGGTPEQQADALQQLGRDVGIEPGAGQEVSKAAAQNEQKLVEAMVQLKDQIIILNKSLTDRKALQLAVGGTVVEMTSGASVSTRGTNSVRYGAM